MSEQENRIAPTKYVPPDGRLPSRRRVVRTRSVVVGAALALAAFAAWFVLTSKAVYIEVEPGFAKVHVSGGLRLNLADRYLLRAGSYTLRIEAPGYRGLEQNLEVGADQNQEFTFTLDRLPGHLRVSTGAVEGAVIELDGENRGRTPVLIRDVPAGDYPIRLVAERYLAWEGEVSVEGLDREQVLEVSLQPAWADLTFVSRPEDAEVLVDDEAVGRTPVTAAVLQGVRRLRVHRPGFKPWLNEVDVDAGVPMEFADIVLEPADAIVHLASSPSRASVTVNGEYRGVTPLEVAVTPDRDVRVRLFRQGYRSASRTLQVASGDERRLQIDLEAERVPVAFRITPADAELYIDGRRIENSAESLQLPTRPHRVEIRRSGYVDYATTLTPHSGMPQRLQVTLKSQEQARLEQIKPVIETVAGQRLKLFRPGPFTMGASRREPGRRANETLRDVKLQRPFYLGFREVSNDEFREFDARHSSGTIFGRSLDTGRQPVVRITWEQAARYCNWLSGRESLEPFYLESEGRIVGVNPLATGYRLPTEAEWEWAARTRAGGGPLKFPWDGNLPPPANSGNFADVSVEGMIAGIIRGYDDGHVVAAPVGSFPAGNRGLHDMGGNVSEWTHDFYDVAIRMAGAVEVDPLGPETGEFHVIKGSGWTHGTVTELRLSYRDYAAKPREDVGFRLARYLE
ncbi:PEGA domain-containing protein [Elongatibacter sediminis]|uniref:PEGA domain-containing protein n=1 Tax=Elongatibacter sediminis TaxID=3119006 RepID=A0AAW9R502_9GAMM